MAPLHPTLAHLVAAAAARPGCRQVIKLQNGLRVQVTLTTTHFVYLTLLRFNTQPSTLEFLTVLRHWPRPLPSTPIRPSAYRDGARHYLAARWPEPLPDPTPQANLL